MVSSCCFKQPQLDETFNYDNHDNIDTNPINGRASDNSTYDKSHTPQLSNELFPPKKIYTDTECENPTNLETIDSSNHIFSIAIKNIYGQNGFDLDCGRLSQNTQE